MRQTYVLLHQREALLFAWRITKVAISIGAVFLATAGTAVGAPPSRNLPACIQAAQSLEETEGTYTCVEEHTTEGRTFRYGDPGFLENLGSGTEFATVVSRGSQVKALVAAGRRIARTTEGVETPAPLGPNKRSARKSKPRRSLTALKAATYQSYFEELISYGIIRNRVYTQYGSLRLTHNINLNGRQVQNTPTLNVTTGPSVAPGVSLSSECGSTSWGPASARYSWYPGMQSTYCSGDGTFRNRNTWNWTT